MGGSDARGHDPTVLATAAADSLASADDRLAPGIAAGDYVVDRHLGSGAMGDVYAGHHPAIGKRVAIKVLKRALAGRPEAASRFVREARAVNHVDHPAVVDVFAIGRLDDGRLFLVMDLLDGRTLRDRLQAGPLAPALALRVLREIALALDAAHAKGVIHRDLKPDNVMLTGADDAPTAHVLDFGIARMVAEVADQRTLETLTGQGTWLGTPAYMAPEQWSADGATAASDRYALGIIAYELLSGRAPFTAPSLPAMMEQHFRAAVPSVTAAGRGEAPARERLPAAVDRVLARALAKDPAARFATGAALVEALTTALDGRTPAGLGTVRRWPALVAGGVGVAGAAVLLFGRGADRPAAAIDPDRPAARGATIEVSTVPDGARVFEDGEDRGATPLVLSVAPGREVAIELVRPGYVTVERRIAGDPAAPTSLRVNLALVTGFEGVWALPDGGGLRAFERRGEQVAGFSLVAADGERSFLRFFEFVPTRAGAEFVATEPFVDERAPDEPSCNIPLRARYHYEPQVDRLELVRERARYTLAAGRCVLSAVEWSEPRALVRVVGAAADATWAESRAGAGIPQIANAAVTPPAPANQAAVGKDDARPAPPVAPVGGKDSGGKDGDPPKAAPVGKKPGQRGKAPPTAKLGADAPTSGAADPPQKGTPQTLPRAAPPQVTPQQAQDPGQGALPAPTPAPAPITKPTKKAAI